MQTCNSDDRLTCGAAMSPRTITLGAEAFWDQAGEWTLGVGTFQITRVLGDHSAQRSLYATVRAPLISPPASGPLSAGTPCYALVGFSAHVIGAGFSGMPSTAARLQLMSPAQGVMLAISDPSANTTALNTAHAIGTDLSGTPLAFTDPTDPLLIEFDSPFGGTGYGSFKFVNVQLTLAPSALSHGGAARLYGDL